MRLKDRLKITDPGGLVQQPHDPYMDGPITRREVQMAVNDLCRNEAQLMANDDTVHIVVNFLCEKLGVTRGELDAYVAQKKAEMAALQAAQEARKKAEADNGRSDS